METEGGVYEKGMDHRYDLLVLLVTGCGTKEEGFTEKPTTIQGAKIETIKLSPSRKSMRPWARFARRPPVCSLPRRWALFWRSMFVKEIG